MSSRIKTTATSDPYLSVSEVTRLINDIFEVQFPQLLFRGEISQLQIAQSGHVYFTVKDEGAQISCVMWAGVARTLQFKPAAGKTVRCHGRPNVYPQSGRLQVIVHRMVEDGEGELQRKFLELKARLEKDGFFAPERKRPLPFLPKAVGIVTSKTGAVIHDMMVKIRERFPQMVVYLRDTRVQGEGAATEIAQAIREVDRSRLVDVIIVARGGGSLEDLWAFNEEEVVKAVFSCSVPVVSGVGHEVDVTLCDLAADVRAPTPTAAAEMVVPRTIDLLARIAELERRLLDFDRWLQPRVQRVDDLTFRLESRISGLLEEARLRVRMADARLSIIRPDRVVELLRSRVDMLAQRLGRSGEITVQALRTTVDALRERLTASFSIEALSTKRLVLDGWERRLTVAATRNVEAAQRSLTEMEVKLEALSPERVLERGFGILTVDGKHVKSVKGVPIGANMEVCLTDGVVKGTVAGTKARVVKEIATACTESNE
jgi:exodeoxyribonuclease VII large subunit